MRPLPARQARPHQQGRLVTNTAYGRWIPTTEETSNAQ